MPFAGYKNFNECVRKNSSKRNPKGYCAEIMRKVEKGRGQINEQSEASPMSEEAAPIIEKPKAKSTRDIPLSERYSDIREDVLMDSEIEGGRPKNVYWVNATKVGAKAYTSLGQAVIFTKEALEANYKSWIGGIVTVNHVKHVSGGILKAKFEEPFVKLAVRVDNPRLKTLINSGSVEGVSIEAADVEIEADQIKSFKGTGISFVVYPEQPACGSEDGCGLTDSLEAAEPKKDGVDSLTMRGEFLTSEQEKARKREIFEAIGVWKETKDALDVKSEDASPKVFPSKVAAAEPTNDHYSVHGGDCKCHEKLQETKKDEKMPEPEKTAVPAASETPTADAVPAKTEAVAESAAIVADTVPPVVAAVEAPKAEEPKKEEAPCGCKELEAAIIQAKEINDKQGGVIASLRKELEDAKKESTELRAFRHKVTREPLEVRAKALGLPEKVVATLDNEGLTMAVEAVEKVAAKGSGAVTGTALAESPKAREPTFEEIDEAYYRFTHGGASRPKK